MTNCSLYQTLLHVTNLQYCDLGCFNGKFILSQFTHFCVEQNLTQTSCPWSKNDKFHVWWRDSTCVFNEYNQAKIIIQMWHYLSFWLLCYVNDPTKQGIIYCFMNLPINIYIKCSGIFHREFFAILNILCNILIFILYYKSWASSWQPFGPALGPSCLLDFVLRAQRARRLCDPRNDALDSEQTLVLLLLLVVVVILLLLLQKSVKI